MTPTRPPDAGDSAETDDEVRDLIVRLIAFVASAKASHAAKNDALDAIDGLRARVLP